MEFPIRAGDKGSAHCPRCRQIVRTRFEHRAVQLRNTRLVVPHVMVDVCTLCDHMISFPRQSMAQLRAVGSQR